MHTKKPPVREPVGFYCFAAVSIIWTGGFKCSEHKKMLSIFGAQKIFDFSVFS